MDYHFVFGICCTFLFKSILQNEWNLQKCLAEPQDCNTDMGMDQYLLIPFLVG